jgi:hypothetical protein
MKRNDTRNSINLIFEKMPVLEVPTNRVGHIEKGVVKSTHLNDLHKEVWLRNQAECRKLKVTTRQNQRKKINQ